jgi:hypothetical protein
MAQNIYKRNEHQKEKKGKKMREWGKERTDEFLILNSVIYNTAAIFLINNN